MRTPGFATPSTVARRAELSLGAVAVTVLLAGCAAAQQEPRLTIDRMVVISDGDHAASTYVDGRLAPAGAGFRDLLTTVSVTDGAVSTAQLEVPNSVTAAPEVLALAPGGDVAFVAERLTARRAGDTMASELAPGTLLTAIDVSDLAAPQVITAAQVAASPESIAVSPDGTRVAVAANPPGGAVVQVLAWSGGAFGAPVQTAVATAGDIVTNVQWRPDGQLLAVNVDNRDQVAFFSVDEDGVLTDRGAPVATGVDPFVGRFTPDGRFYLTANWGRDLSTTVAADRLPDDRSTLSVIEVDDAPAAAHRVVHEAQTDVSSEGLAISPDGTLVATVNMRGTVFPPDSPKFDEHASVSLLRLADDGALTKIGDHPLIAVLPEGGSFDTTGRYFVATSYEGRGDEGGSGLQIYGVDADDGLTPLQRIDLPHGAHHVVVG